MENALIAIGIGLGIWLALMWAILALLGFASSREPEMQKPTARVRAGAAYGEVVKRSSKSSG